MSKHDYRYTGNDSNLAYFWSANNNSIIYSKNSINSLVIIIPFCIVFQGCVYDK